MTFRCNQFLGRKATLVYRVGKTEDGFVCEEVEGMEEFNSSKRKKWKGGRLFCRFVSCTTSLVYSHMIYKVRPVGSPTVFKSFPVSR